MSHNPAKYEVLIKQFLRSMDISVYLASIASGLKSSKRHLNFDLSSSLNLPHCSCVQTQYIKNLKISTRWSPLFHYFSRGFCRRSIDGYLTCFIFCHYWPLNINQSRKRPINKQTNKKKTNKQETENLSSGQLATLPPSQSPRALADHVLGCVAFHKII